MNPLFLVALGDVFLNLAAGWFGAAVIIPGTHARSPRMNLVYIGMNILFGIIALVIGYQLRIVEI
jgi:hypothetical protein